VLLGRQRTSVTTNTFDDDGHLLQSVSVHDALWTEEDLGYAKAHRRNQLDKCPGCGLPLSETTNPDHEGMYEAPQPTRCHACTPLEHRKSEYLQSPPGLLFRVFSRVKKAIGQ
jgi:hypothetical protein